MKKLETEEKIFEVQNYIDKEIMEKSKMSPDSETMSYELTYLKNSIMADEKLKLKKGALVMCVANIDMQSESQIVNGSQGIIVDFINNFPVVRFRKWCCKNNVTS